MTYNSDKERLESLRAQIRDQYGRSSEGTRRDDSDLETHGGEAGSNGESRNWSQRPEPRESQVIIRSARGLENSDSGTGYDSARLSSGNDGSDQPVQQNNGSPTIGFNPLRSDALPRVQRIDSNEPVKRVVDRTKRTAKKVTETVRESIPSVPLVIEADKRKFTEDERDKLRKDLIEAIQGFGVYLDAFAYAVGKRHENDVIFGNIDDEDAGTLADSWIERAKYSRQSSTRMRTFIRIHDEYIRVSIIIGPRAFRYAMKLWSEGIGFA